MKGALNMELTYRMENGHRLPNLDVPEELKASDQIDRKSVV